MRPYILVLAMLCIAPNLFAQNVYTIKADSVKITNNCDTAELILENHTQNVMGYLYNKGRGRTEFRKVVKLNDSTLVFGDDTLVMRGTISTASNGLSLFGNEVRLGQTVDDHSDPALLTENREIPVDDYSVKFIDKSTGHHSSISTEKIIVQWDEEFTGEEEFSIGTTNATLDRKRLEFNSHEHTYGSFGRDSFEISRVGILNTDPIYTLDVIGSGRFTDSLLLSNMQSGSSTDAVVVWDNSSKVLKQVPQAGLSNTISRAAVNDANYTATSYNCLVAYIALSTGRTVTLPRSSSMSNKTLIIKDESGSAGTHNIAVDGFGSETFDGAANKVINSNFRSITVYSNGSYWFTIHQ